MNSTYRESFEDWWAQYIRQHLVIDPHLAYEPVRAESMKRAARVVWEYLLPLGVPFADEAKQYFAETPEPDFVAPSLEKHAADLRSGGDGAF